MKYFRKHIKKFLILFILLIIYIYVANITLLPNSIILMQGEKPNIFTLWGINVSEETGKLQVGLNLFNNPINKTVSVSVIPKTTVIPLGNSIGLKLYTQGVLVVGMSEIDGTKPYENSGIEAGDRIIQINNQEIKNTTDLVETVNSSDGKEITVKYVKEDNAEVQTTILPVRTEKNEYKIGLWVRDAAAGVGTATFYEPSTGYFASLGHGITDVDTGDLISIANGELVNANIISITKGAKGVPGELRGSIENGTKLGEVSKNTAFGIYGKVTNTSYLNITSKEMEVANREEIQTGKAQIICQIDNGTQKYYDIEIKKIYKNNNYDNKSMLIKVTDEELLEKTGGIIQGMSGSPIIQNGKFIRKCYTCIS